VKYYAIIADRLSEVGFNSGCVARINSNGQTTFVAAAQRDGGKRFVVYADEKLSAFVELERQVLTVAFYLESIHASERDCLRYGACGLGRFRRCCLRRSAFTHNILIVLLRNRFLADM
jgi:hypothetical protein